VDGEASAWDTVVEGRHVVIRHGEPTLRRDLGEALGELRRRRPASVSLLTNGRMLAYPAVTQALAQAGVDRFVVKLFGLEAATHDAHTRTPGSFEQAVRGIENARATGAEVAVTFPLAAGARDRAGTLETELAQRLTGGDPIEFPEPHVEAGSFPGT
jgi:molybdenum cofactor biosynthesis enzyme MoaA